MTITVDIEKEKNGLYDVYIATDFSSGLHYKDVTIENIGVLLSDEVQVLDNEGYLQ